MNVNVNVKVNVNESLVPGGGVRVTRHPIRRTALGLVLCLLGALVSQVEAQVTVRVTSTPGTNVPVYGQMVDTITLANAGLSSISDVNVDLDLSSASGMTMRLGQMYATLTHGTASENERVAVLINRPGVSSSSAFGSSLQGINIKLDDHAVTNVYNISSGTGTYAADGRIGVNPFGTRVAYSSGDITAGLSALNGDWLASNTWSLLVADAQDGNQARLNSWGLEITGTANTGATSDPGQGGRISATTSGTQNIGGARSTGQGAAAVSLEAGDGVVLQLNGALQGAGDFKKEGQGVARLTTAATNFTGTFKVTSGEVEVANAAALGTGNLDVASGAKLRVAPGVSLSNALAVAAGQAKLAGGTNNNDVSTITGQITGGGGIEKTGAGKLVIAATNSFTGVTTVSEGKLVVNGDISASTNTVVSSGAILGGSGRVGALEIASGGVLAVGNSPGQLNAGNTTWAGGAEYDWEIDDFAGNDSDFLAGRGTNWDFLNITGTLNVTADSNSKFIIDVLSLLANDNATGGNADNWDPLKGYSFSIATASGGIQIGGANFGSFGSQSAFDTALNDLFSIRTNPGFTNATGSAALWNITTSAGGQTLLLNYNGGATAIPEPNSASLVLLGLGIACLRRRRNSVRGTLSK